MDKERLTCGSSLCIFDSPEGMRTNGSCMCLEGLDKENRLRVQKWVLRAKEEIAELKNEMLSMSEALSKGDYFD